MLFLPGVRRLRFRVRSLVLLVAALAVGMAAVMVWIPWIRWRIRVDRVIREKLEPPSTNTIARFEETPTFQTVKGLSTGELEDLLRDPKHVVDELLITVARAKSEDRRSTAARSISNFLRLVESPELPKSAFNQLLALALSDKMSPRGESAIVFSFIHPWITHVDLDDQQRSAILDRARTHARASRPDERLARWLYVLDQVGCRDETKFLLGLARHPDPEVRRLVHESGLCQTRWRGVLPYLREWLDDDETASWAFRYQILATSSEGRAILWEYASSRCRPIEHRRTAMRMLKRDRGGVALLLEACEDAGRRAIVAELFGPDKVNLFSWSHGLPAQIDGWSISQEFENAQDPSDPRPELRKLLAREDVVHDPWFGLIHGVAPNFWARGSRTVGSAADQREFIDRNVQNAERILQELTGRSDLTTPEAWMKWYNETKPSLVARRRWLELNLKYHGLLNYEGYNRDFDFYKTMPPDCLPLYEQLARRGPEWARLPISQMLLLYADRLEEIPYLIDRIEQEVRQHPRKVSRRNPFPLQILQRRFAVNYLWDVSAWRSWWAREQTQIGSDDRKNLRLPAA
jgi:hypothetical protein